MLQLIDLIICSKVFKGRHIITRILLANGQYLLVSIIVIVFSAHLISAQSNDQHSTRCNCDGLMRTNDNRSGTIKQLNNSPNKQQTNNWSSSEINSKKAQMTIEVAVFLDQVLISRYAAQGQGLVDLNKFVQTVMDQVRYIFKYSSLNESIDIKLILVESVRESERRGLINYVPETQKGDIDQYLSSFCQWQKKRLDTNRESLWWDHAILLSGLDLYKATSRGNNSGVLGLSWVGGMCKTNFSCTVGEALNLESAFVIAHEIGHSLGMMHDGAKNKCDPNKFIMSDKTGPGKVNWSQCSRDYLADSIRHNQLSCLTKLSSSNSTNSIYDLSKLKPPGQVYNLNEQCRLAYGRNYSHHMSDTQPYNNVCKELWCISGTWTRPVHPALDGSRCDLPDQSQGVCREGSCVSSSLN